MPAPSKCPECGAELKVQRYYMDGWLLEEENQECTNPECGWYYEYSYGSYRTGKRSEDCQPPVQSKEYDDIPF